MYKIISGQFIGLTILFFICDYTNSAKIFANESQDIQNNDFVDFQNTIIGEINKQRLSYAEDMKILQDQRLGLMEEVQSYSEIVNGLNSEIKKLHARIEEVQEQRKNDLKEYEKQHAHLIQIIEDERLKNQQANEKILGEIISQIEQINHVENTNPLPENGKHKLYKVVKGDTLGSIAKAFGVPLGILKDFNKLESDLIIVDQVLKIPIDE